MRVDRPVRPIETAEWALTVVGGPSAGTRLAWDQPEMVLGREAAGAALFRADPAVSRRHAIIRVLDGTYVVEDHNSTNGTFVNDVPIDRLTVLGPEDELRIGGTRLRLAPTLAATAQLALARVPEPDTTKAKHPRARHAGELTLSIIAAIAGTVLASALNGSPQLRLAAAALGSAVPAFMTEPGRHRRARVTAAVVLMTGALFVTYGGAALFSYATDRPPIYPIPVVSKRPAHTVTPTPPTTGPGTQSPAVTPTTSTAAPATSAPTSTTSTPSAPPTTPTSSPSPPPSTSSPTQPGP